FNRMRNPERRANASLPGKHYLQDYWMQGLRLGVIASSDEHSGQGGRSHGGIAAVWAQELTREEIFDAIRSKRCYATTGERILLHFDIDGELQMGQSGRREPGSTLRIRLKVWGTDLLNRVEILRYRFGGRDCTFRPVLSNAPRPESMDFAAEVENRVDGACIMCASCRNRWRGPPWPGPAPYGSTPEYPDRHLIMINQGGKTMPRAAGRPNIIFITCHDLGDYLGCYGTPVQTPRLDAFAREGVRFASHFSTGTICSPARGSIITGCYPHTHGLMGLVHRGWELEVDRCRPLPDLLAAHGYSTHLFGFQHEHRDAGLLGYQEVHATPGHHCDEVVPVFCDWLAEQTRCGGAGLEAAQLQPSKSPALHRPRQPFLAAIGFSEVHRMGLKPSHFRRDRYIPADMAEVEVRPYLPDIPAIRRDLADFYGAIRFMDEWTGRLLDAVDAAGIRGETLIIFTTDHGASFIHSKATLYEGGTRVALLMSWKGVLPEGCVVQGLSSHVDILPTLMELIGLPAPDQAEGMSLWSCPAGGKTTNIPLDNTSRPYAFSEENFNNHFAPARAVRSKRYRYIKYGINQCVFDYLIPEIELSSFDFRGNRDVFDFYSADRVEEELFDLEQDSGERMNLAADPAHAPVLQEMRSALTAHMKKTQDPFRDFRNPIRMQQHAYTAYRDRNKR
ncbi:MAG TPA: hypothetical protein DD727_04725, partial [Clostridiales bacterium]|nr:hypothetical protein [Clostridiales bacterium]